MKKVNPNAMLSLSMKEKMTSKEHTNKPMERESTT